MFKNYLKVAARNLLKQKSYSFINILGLAVGIAASVLISLYVLDELSYDKFHDKADRTYRIAADWSNKGDSKIHQLGTPAVLSKTLRDKYPQVETVTQINGPILDCTLKAGEKAFKEAEAYLAEPSFFQVFSFTLLEGDPMTSLRDPNTVVLAQSVAAKLFGAENPMGRKIQLYAGGSPELLRVTGVVRDVPTNSHFRFGLLVSMATDDPMTSPQWDRNNFTTYLVLRNGITQKLMEEKLIEIDKIYCYGGMAHPPWIWTLEPLTEIHLKSDLATGDQPNGSLAYVRLFALAAVLILLIAVINFINLATARSTRRAREVGIRKTVGSLQRQLVGQFLGESVLVSLIALVLGIGIIQLALPLYRSLTGKDFGVPYFSSPFVIPGLVGLALAVGLLSGLYPAFFLSSFKPANVLKSSSLSSRGGRSPVLRNGLVVFQFAVSILLIIGTLVIFRQLDYIKNKRLGFDKDNVVIVNNAESMGSQLAAYEELLKQHPDIRGVTAVGSIPGQGTPNWGIGMEGIGRERPLNMNFLTCDQEFAATLNIRIQKGRFLSRAFTSDTNAVVINEKAAQYFGLPDPLGKKLRIWWTRKELTIVGIIENIHFESLHKNVISMGYLLPEAVNSSRKPYLLVKIKSQKTTGVLAYLQKTWESLSSGLPFEFSFMDEKVNGLYQNDIRAGKVVSLFSILAIFVSCLGLFGLANYVAERRTKEIGVRKILGARLGSILWLLTKQFVKWVVVANLIAWPLGYWLMSRWLQGFAFRTGLPAWVFLAGGLAAVAIAVVTVSSQVLRAAYANPVDSLRYE